jgi:hypothetical protein
MVPIATSASNFFACEASPANLRLLVAKAILRQQSLVLPFVADAHVGNRFVHKGAKSESVTGKTTLLQPSSSTIEWCTVVLENRSQ